LQTQSVTINFTGGIVSPGYLKEILEIAATARVSYVRFGLRQQMIMDVPANYAEAFIKACEVKNIVVYKSREALPNIVSTYVAAGIFTVDSWLREGVYKDIFNLFDYTPQLKINICDSRQSFAPFFTGHINWIASDAQHFWQLYIRFPKTNKIYQWKELVYTNEVPAVSQLIEKQILEKKDFYGNSGADGDVLFSYVKAAASYVSKALSTEDLVGFSLPYYEGFNQVNNQWWLGIYRRNELYAVQFLLDVCNLCLQTRIGQLYTTSWKSIIVKNIEKTDRKLWDNVLGKYRINVRHAANELNWQVEDYTDEGLQLKAHIIRHFDKEDVRTYGLCFAVQTKPVASMFGSIVISKQQSRNRNRLKVYDRYDILYKKDFNPNAEELLMFREGVEKEHIGTYLVSLCKYFYEQGVAVEPLETPKSQPETVVKAASLIYHCKHCFTVYDEAAGDEAQGIAAGTKFESLPSSYTCPLCDALKEDFITVEETQLIKAV